MEGKKPNRLIHEKSPYLLQHAFNPVEWYPWGEEAFAKARRENKPIFLSIGYSTCYWCHVMERDVFENDSIAELMNASVVSIKVDREERPDVDRVYMTALMAMAGSGGWPMSLFLTPDRKPFYAATYIPAKPAYGRAGFPQVLSQVMEVWDKDRAKITDVSENVGAYLRSIAQPDITPVDAGASALEGGFDAFRKGFDSVHGGFGQQPKFPRPVAFNFLLSYYQRTGNAEALNMTLLTLIKMREGGMYDHVGGGFHRYSTDATWHVPHFEKMLYDQAQLAIAYLEAFQITHEPFYADVARDVLQYVRNDMTDPNGGFYSAQDAESATDRANPDAKKEGAFYTWTKEEVDAVLTDGEANIFEHMFDVRPEGNVRSDPHDEFGGLNILHAVHSLEETAEKFNVSPDAASRLIAAARKKLRTARKDRPSPHLDDKVLVSWNGLMISAFARAYQVLGDEAYRRSAERAGTFIMDKMFGKTLLRRYRDGDVRFEGHLEDYAFLTQGMIDLYEASFDIRWLKSAMQLTKLQNSLFYDATEGGFFDISGADTTVLVKTKEYYDGALPTGNAIAILDLLRLSEMTGNEELRSMANRSLKYFGERMQKLPDGLAQFLVALDFSLSKPQQIILAGTAEDPHTQEILQEVHATFNPNRIVMLADGGEGQEFLTDMNPFFGQFTMIDGKATAYICENYACKLPTSDVKAIAQMLQKQPEQPKR